MSRLARPFTVALLVASLALPAIAKDTSEVVNDLKTGEDFRLRSSAALALGKMKDPSVRPALERALGSDPHAAVRASAASALGALGDASAIDALRKASANDENESVRKAAASAIAKLETKKKPTKVLVRIGKMQNKTGIGGSKMETMLASATRDRAARLSGVEVITGDDDRKLPVVVIEGTVAKLAQSDAGSEVSVSAEVQYVVKRESALKVSVSGRAKAQGDGGDVSRIESLQEAALAGAVDSALRDPAALLAAAK